MNEIGAPPVLGESGFWTAIDVTRDDVGGEKAL